MGHRLSKIYTRTGDDGTTGLGDGTRVAKDDARVEAYGSVDELNSAIGILLAEALPEEIAAPLLRVQHRLFDLGGELCIPGHILLSRAEVDDLEATLDRLNGELAPLKEFVLPGGARAAALCHFARTICRRAERRVFALSRRDTIPPASLAYLNRLSDLLFVMSRYLNKAAGHPETLWQPLTRD